MADFNPSWKKTSRHEAGTVDNSNDKGKLTYRGITTASHPDWEGWPIVHKAIADLGITATLNAGRAVWAKIDAALAGNTVLDAMVQEFYKKNYWDPLDLDNEPSQLIADEVFDTAVNMGVGAARKFIEEARRNTHA